MKSKKLFLALILSLILSALFTSCMGFGQGVPGTPGETGAQGPQGESGKSAYELYCEYYGYEGSEEQWLIDLRTGALVSFNVTYDLNGGVAPEGFVSSDTVLGGSFLDLTTPIKEGYTFLGWWTGDGNTDFAMSETIAVRSDLALTAKWRKDVMSVRFLDKEGNLLKQETVHYGNAATAPQAPEVEAFMFKKWDVDFSVITEDLIVKAIYSPLYTLSFNTDGGTTIEDVIYLPEDIPTTPVDPQKDDLVFRGWFADEDFTVPFDFSAPLTQNTTVYAYFSDLKPISNVEELKAIGDNSTGKFYLTNDINLGGEVWTPLADFAGEFDGRGYKIHDFIVSETQSAGFFTTNSGTIQNLTLADFAFTVSAARKNITFNAGALVGTNDGKIENCHITNATLAYHCWYYGTGYRDSFVGGLVGINNGTVCDSSIYAKITCCSEAHVDYSEGGEKLWLGVVVGKNTGIIVNTNSNADVDVSEAAFGSGSAAPFINLGGLVSLNSGEVTLCESDISVTASNMNTGYEYPRIHFGGFVYQNSGIISQCSAEGVFDTANTSLWHTEVGGFVANNEQEITDCYTNVTLKTAKITTSSDGNKVGGFVAINSGTITTSYTSSNIETSAVGRFGGFAASNESGGVIKNCFATGNITNKETNAQTGVFVGRASNGGALFKNYYDIESKLLQKETDVTVADGNATATDLATLQSKGLLVDELGWNTEIWEIVDGQYPTLIENK